MRTFDRSSLRLYISYSKRPVAGNGYNSTALRISVKPRRLLWPFASTVTRSQGHKVIRLYDLLYLHVMPRFTFMMTQGEYIYVTERVEKGQDNAPMILKVLFSPTRPRNIDLGYLVFHGSQHRLPHMPINVRGDNPTPPGHDKRLSLYP